jgi:hypothetical protein
MASSEAVITASLAPDVEASIIGPHRVTYPGPIELCIKKCQVLGAGGKPVRILKEGDDFYLCMDIYYSELLGDLEADFVAEFHVMNLATCGIVKTYCCSVEGKLECDTTKMRVCCKYRGTEKGVFTYTATIALPKSDLFDFCCYEECFGVAPTCHHDKVTSIKTPGN